MDEREQRDAEIPGSEETEQPQTGGARETSDASGTPDGVSPDSDTSESDTPESASADGPGDQERPVDETTPAAAAPGTTTPDNAAPDTAAPDNATLDNAAPAPTVETQTAAAGAATPQRVGTPRPTPYPRTGGGAAATTAGTVADPAPSRLRRTGRAVSRTLVTLLSVVALVVTGYAYARLDQLHDALETTDALDEWGYSGGGDDELPPAPPEEDAATDILLVGSDSRTDMQGNPLPLDVLKALRTESTDDLNTDTMIILRIPKDGSDPVGVSIPRDTWVDVPGGGKDKINSVYGTAKNKEWARLQSEGVSDRARLERDSNQAGRRALVRTLQDFTQVHIDHYAEINLLGFYMLTESIGGVEVCLNAPTQDKDSGADFAAGVQTVSGGEALSFVRQRKNLPNGDLDRIVRQHTFLSSALNKTLSTGTLTDPNKLSDLIETVRRSLVLDPDLDVLGFAQQANELVGGGLDFETIPVRDIAARSDDGQSIVTVDLEEVRSFIRGLAHGQRSQADEGARGGGGAPQGGPALTQARTDVPCVN
ncbi:LCP family protein [Prauserella rugosa]|uniref:LytR family transcriptional attenuator n=1 Tax=Prauserella rugosa TaxID=43354 RepID=A0A660CMG0_9PSEU|nr:LCP family protein [Prauserella rugosa]TWH22431.1 LytR family transcriptional attenuator [Prauserella rugosa]